MPREKRPAAAAALAALAAEDAVGYDEEAASQQPRKTKKPKVEKKVKEKRCSASGATVRYRGHPSLKDSDRIDRALSRGLGVSHRLFLIDRQVLDPVDSEAGGREKFVVLGATGNVYDVVISKHPKCSCPDAARGNICKHRFFVMLRVLKLEQSDPIVWQQALLSSEVRKALSSNRSCEASALASSSVKDAYLKATGNTPTKAKADEAVTGPPPEDDCPICYEDFQSAPEASEQCQTCCKFVHAACMKAWLSKSKESGAQLKCVLCRGVWKDTQGQAMTVDGYLNIGGAEVDSFRMRQLYGNTVRWIG